MYWGQESTLKSKVKYIITHLCSMLNVNRVNKSDNYKFNKLNIKPIIEKVTFKAFLLESMVIP